MITTDVPRLAYEVPMRPLVGSTFQPTGFPDIGAAEFTRISPDGQGAERTLLVESVQSMANRLEATAWDRGAAQPAALIAALPYARVHRAPTGDFLTSSRLEAHRLASAFIRDAELDGRKMVEVIGERLGLAKDTPLNYPAMARAILRLDPFCLLHGVFFNAKPWFGQPRFTRAVSAVIEAYGVDRAVSGGRKADVVRHQLGEGVVGGTSEGYGSVPFHRVAWTAREIRAMFVVDTELLRSYGLGPAATELLTCLALWEIRSLLSGGLRLRTACDLELDGDIQVRRGDLQLPQVADLSTRIAELIAECGEEFADGPLTVAWKG